MDSLIYIYEIDSTIRTERIDKMSVTITFCSSSQSISVVNEEFEIWASSNKIEIIDINRLEKISFAVSKDSTNNDNGSLIENLIQQSQREESDEL